MLVVLEVLAMLAFTIGVALGGAVAILYAHEAGHCLAGRWLVGIPASETGIVLSRSGLHHVALRDDDG